MKEWRPEGKGLKAVGDKRRKSMTGWRADEISKEGEDDEVEMRDFCKTGEKRRVTMEGMRRRKNDQDQTSS